MSVRVGQLWHYPVKSMQGEATGEALLGRGGVIGDRAYGLVDVEAGRLVSAKHPQAVRPDPGVPGRLHRASPARMLQIGTEADDPAGERMIGFPPAMGAPGTLNDLAAMHVLTTSTLAAVEVSRATDGPLANAMVAMAAALESESRT